MLARTVGQIPCAAIAKRQLACERAWGSCIIAPGLPVRRQWSGQLEHQQRRPLLVLLLQNRFASSSSSTRWKSRQGRDSYAREAKVAGLKSRAAFKLLEINEKYKLFRRGDTVVDLGFAPGSWSQVAVNRTSPGGRVVGIDIIPAQPPRGANALQGNFLSAEIREEVRKFVSDPDRGRVRSRTIVEDDVTEEDLQQEHQGIVQLEMHAAQNEKKLKEIPKADMTQKQLDLAEGRVVNVVLSDMSAPWPLVTSSWIRSVSNPYLRLMNTSGIAARDHGGSMDLCMAALTFCFDTLSTGGNFICKFYTGAEDHAMEMRLKKLFEKVHRIKPDSTRKESKEAYFVGLRRKAGAKRAEVLEDG
ncbi:rRNA Methyltransferase [Sphaerulina musiva]